MKKQNFSSQRQAILKAICSTDCHPSARWIYDTLKADYPSLSLGTVYRNVALFKKQGFIVSVANVAGEEHIDGNLTPHAHFICNKCGQIYDIFNENLNKIDDLINESGFLIESSTINFHGICNLCKDLNAQK